MSLIVFALVMTLLYSCKICKTFTSKFQLQSNIVAELIHGMLNTFIIYSRRHVNQSEFLYRLCFMYSVHKDTLSVAHMSQFNPQHHTYNIMLIVL